MDSEGLWADVRRVVVRSDVLGLAVAVVVGTALFQLLYAVVEYVLMPLGRGVFHAQEAGDFGPSSQPLYVTFHGYAVYWGEAVSLAATLALAVFVVLVLRRRLFREEDELADDVVEGSEEKTHFRTCPECLSDIPTAARRCAYCTASLTPLERQE
jgi:large conductance mechanosensitive channel